MQEFNSTIRPTLFAPTSESIAVEGMDSCFDCRSEMEILRNYALCQQSGQDLSQLLSSFQSTITEAVTDDVHSL